MKKLRVVAIFGPTASGKSEIAATLARRWGSEVVSVDSRQVYRGLDLGTGKDLDLFSAEPVVPLHLVDLVDPEQVYTLYDYQAACYRIFEEASERLGDVPLILCGGTGLYAEAVLRHFELADVAPDLELRQRLEYRGKESLIEELRELDPTVKKGAELATERRLIRAIEIALAERAREVQRSRPPKVELEHHIVVLDPPMSELEQRICARLQTRVRAGLIDEIVDLAADGLSLDRLEALGLEYRELGRAVHGLQSIDDAIARLEVKIRAFARRQRTWFRGMPRRGLETRTLWPADADTLESFLKPT